MKKTIAQIIIPIFVFLLVAFAYVNLMYYLMNANITSVTDPRHAPLLEKFEQKYLPHMSAAHLYWSFVPSTFLLNFGSSFTDPGISVLKSISQFALPSILMIILVIGIHTVLRFMHFKTFKSQIIFIVAGISGMICLVLIRLPIIQSPLNIVLLFIGIISVYFAAIIRPGNGILNGILVFLMIPTILIFESAFNIQGLLYLLKIKIVARDYPVITGTTYVIFLLSCLGGLFSYYMGLIIRGRRINTIIG